MCTTCGCVHTCAVLLASVLGHSNLTIDHRFARQDVFVVAITRRGPLIWRAAWACPVAVLVRLVDLGEYGGFVEQGEVPLKVKVLVQVLKHGVSKALIVLGPCIVAATVPHTVLLGRGLCRCSSAS